MEQYGNGISMRGPDPALPGQTAVVVGAGQSGIAAAGLLQRLGAEVRLVERDPAKAELVREQGFSRKWEVVAGEHNQNQFAHVDMVVLSPGVNRLTLDPWLGQIPADRVMSELELAYRCVSEPIIAVTGTNGKTTTTTLIGRFLTALGLKVFVGGNIGTPLSQFVLDQTGADVLVLEVSSFQLHGSATFCPDVGLLLNISPNHLDYHADMNEYVQAKLSMFGRQDETDTAIFPEDMRHELDKAEVTRAHRIFFQASDTLHCPALLGTHNQANIEAAFLACSSYGLDLNTAQQALDSFQPLPHRLQVIGEHRDVIIVDDSKCTTIQAMRAALESFDRPVLLLAGGVFKGGDLAGLSPLLASRVRMVGMFGASREIIEQAWGGKVPLFWEPTLERALDRLWAEAKPGDALLLSPGMASFDLFSDYKARGRAFQARVQHLMERDHDRVAA